MNKSKVYTINYIDDNGEKKVLKLQGTEKQFKEVLKEVTGVSKLKQKGNYFYDPKLKKDQIDRLPFIFEFNQNKLNKSICQIISNSESITV